MSARLEKVYQNAERIEINQNTKIVCMSDCHRGVGNRGDNFLPNRHLFFAALQYYYERCFFYIELGDGDELWENCSLRRIEEIHSDIFELMSRFYRSGRFRMLYGNHDRRKEDYRFFESQCWDYYCEIEDACKELFPGLHAQEGILLQDAASGHEILLLHGHQGDLMNDILWKITAALVRFLWKPLELLGVADPTSAARNYKKRKKTEGRLNAFSKQKQILLIAGHTHRPVLSKPGESFYLNDGSCIHPQCITAMELENGAVTLVKWCMTVRRDSTLAVSREVLEGPIPWERYWEKSVLF